MSQGNDQVRETRGGYEEQDQFGNSLANLRANLALTPLERMRKSEALREFIWKYRGRVRRK